MYLVVFRNRLKPDAIPEYTDWATRISELAQSMPGYVAHKGFVAADGERVTVVEFATEEALQAWSRHPDHVDAKRKGRAEFYSEYSLQVCRVERSNQFSATTD